MREKKERDKRYLYTYRSILILIIAHLFLLHFSKLQNDKMLITRCSQIDISNNMVFTRIKRAKTYILEESFT